MDGCPSWTAEELAALQAAPTLGPVSMLYPLELGIPQITLRSLLRSSLMILRQVPPAEETPQQRVAVLQAMQQRIDLLSWLDRQSHDEVLLAVYPAGEEGFDDSVLDELNLVDLGEWLDSLAEEEGGPHAGEPPFG